MANYSSKSYLLRPNS